MTRNGRSAMTCLKSTARLSAVAILSMLPPLLAGCASSGSKSDPELRLSPLFHYMAPGSTNEVVVPANCRYGVWTTDRGILSLQGIFE